MKKLLMVFGTRPEAIKMAPLVNEIKSHRDDLSLSVCITAQHREMLDQVLSLFNIVPDHDFDIMKDGQSLPDLVAQIMVRLNTLLDQDPPDCIIVQGDTATALTASMVAFFRQIPVVHIEAGLRTGNIHSPWPEEFNRRVIGIVTELHFAPTEAARRNLIAERGSDDGVFVTGNTGIDSLLHVSNTLLTKGDTARTLQNKYAFAQEFNRFILMTNHRRENFGSRMEGIFEAISTLARRYPDVGIIFPVHRNPMVRAAIRAALDERPNIRLIDPVDYLDFVYLMGKAHLIITDSGGIQEEAPSLGKPVLLTRDTSERPEAIDAGTVRMVGYDRDKLIDNVTELLTSDAAYSAMSSIKNPYGDGTASTQIVAQLRRTDFTTLLARRRTGG